MAALKKKTYTIAVTAQIDYFTLGGTLIPYRAGIDFLDFCAKRTLDATDLGLVFHQDLFGAKTFTGPHLAAVQRDTIIYRSNYLFLLYNEKIQTLGLTAQTANDIVIFIPNSHRLD